MIHLKISRTPWMPEGGGSPAKIKDGQEKTLEEKTDALKGLLSSPEFKDVVSCDGKLKGPSNEVYQNLSVALGNLNFRMSPKYIYTIILNNRYDVKKEFLAAHNIEVPVEESFANDTTLNSTDCYAEFRLNVSDIWTSIAPETVKHKFSSYERNVRTLRKNTWSHVLFEQMYIVAKIPCAISFKTPKVTDSGIFITVLGTCSECPCEFVGVIANEPQEGEKVFMDCAIYNFDSSVKHAKKRQLKGFLRTAVGNKLLSQNILPCTHRRNEAHRLIHFGEEDSPILFENDITRKAKTEAFDKFLGLNSKNMMENILALKYHENSESAIHGIGLDPFYVHYWTKEQEIMYTTYPKKLVFDGSGSIVKCIILPNGELSSHVYIYQGCAEVNGKSVPVCQMITTSQNTVTILNFMLEFKRSVNSGKSVTSKTEEIITDFDKALLGASCRAFTQFDSLKLYLCACFDYIANTSPTAPVCLLRLDICHYMNMCAKWKCYPEHQPRVRTTYLRTMAVLRKQETFEDIKKVAEAIFILAMYPTTEKKSLADIALQFLKRKIRDLPDDIENNENNCDSYPQSQSEKEMNIIEETELESTNIYFWAKQVYELCENKAKEEPDYDEINAYHLPEFAKKLKSLLPWFPIFSEVMRYSCGFGTKDATSALVESEINDLKNRKFKNVTFPLRGDKFIAFHLKALREHLVEISAGNIELTDNGEYGPTKKMQKKRKDNFIQEHDELNEEHNWRNKNKKPKHNLVIDNKYITQNFDLSVVDERPVTNLNIESSPEKVEKLLYSHTEDINLSASIVCEENGAASDEDFSVICGVDPVKDLKRSRKQREKNKKRIQKTGYGDPLPHFDPLQAKYLTLPVLRNANKCQNVKDKSVIFVIKRTCGFDSLCQIVSLAILNNESYKKALTHLESGIFKCAKLLISQGLKVAVYKQRAITLQDVAILHIQTIEHRKSDNKKVTIKKIEASCYICSLASILFSTLPSCTVLGQCSNCKMKRRETVVVLQPHYNTLENKGLVTLNETVKTVNLPQILCCGSEIKTQVHYGPHVLIESALGKQQSVEICSIQTTIVLNKEQYQLAGLVSYEGVYQKDYVGHYIAFVCSGHHWIEYDDLSQKSNVIDNNSVVDPQLLIFIKKENDMQINR